MRNGIPLLGAQQVNDIVAGAWQTIIGSGTADPFQDILGADVYARQPRYGGGGGYGGFRPNYPGEQPHHRGHHHRHHHHHQPHAWVRGEQIGREGGAAGAWPYAIPPRNELVDRPGPTRADRVILPMSSGVNILPNTSAQITSRPQDVAFRPERIVIGQAGTSGGAADWIVNDVKVGNKSQFSQSGDVPGDLFAATTIDSFVSFATVQTAMDFVMLVTYVGSSESGAPFYCAVLGTAAV